jgi:hypothetical protein
VLTNRLQDLLTKVTTQQLGPKMFMPSINASQSSVFTVFMQHMSEVMEQTRKDYGIRLFGTPSKLSCLQCVIQFADILTVVTVSALVKD